MQIRFNLKSKKTSPSLILLKAHLPGERLPLTLSTGQQINLEFWDNGKMRAKPVKAFPQALWLNALLDKYENLALDFIRRSLVEQGSMPSASALKAHLKAQFSSSAPAPADTFADYFKAHISRMEADPQFSYHTSKMFKVTLGKLLEFAAATRRPLSFSEFCEDWFDDWQNWLFGKSLSQNTVAGYWRKFKVVLNQAAEDGLWKGKSHQRRSLAVSFQRADEVFLNTDELMTLYRLDLSGSHLESVRDLFLLDAFSGGFRFSDLANLDGANIVPLHNVRTIKMHTRKTDTAVYTPASWFFEEFLKKYAGKFPKMKVGQVFNRQIKEVCRLAGLTEPTELRKNVGGEDVYQVKEKCDWVTQYTARYSFATNLFLAGIGLKEISILLGHGSVKTTETYIKAKQLATVMAMSRNPYFTTKPASATG